VLLSRITNALNIERSKFLPSSYSVLLTLKLWIIRFSSLTVGVRTFCSQVYLAVGRFVGTSSFVFFYLKREGTFSHGYTAQSRCLKYLSFVISVLDSGSCTVTCIASDTSLPAAKQRACWIFNFRTGDGQQRSGEE
jgi:hypothetical protein